MDVFSSLKNKGNISLCKKVDRKVNLGRRLTARTSLFYRTEFLREKPVRKVHFYQKMLVTDVVAGKYTEEAPPLKLQPV